MQPAEDVDAADHESQVQRQRHHEERDCRLGEPDDHPRPVSFRELLRRREHHESLGQAGPEHEVDVPGLPRAGRASAREHPEEYGGPGDGEHRAQQHEGPRGELARLLDQRLAGNGGRRAHRRPPALAAFASACSVRT